ncbi:MAG: leucyl/phenylalanyl-tRNA--protein transferase [Gammaproteobacteria bacterium]|nr:leucyl/phenylalanyl-tRNA--protein transferase [Gammaproteobacteria bacterium]
MPFLINPNDTSYEFPDVSLALEEPNGLLAIGGDLSPERLLSAYRHGVFPWFNPGEPILWWSPNPRAVLFPEKIRISRSLRRTLKKNLFAVTTDQEFNEVMAACQAPRAKQRGTWITADMRRAYHEMHRRGYAHSIECWQGTKLAGGLYGMAIGQVFFGESMFSRVSDASKVALVYLTDKLVEWGYRLIDCQVQSEHLISLGAEAIPRDQFCAYLNRWCDKPVAHDAWNRQRLAK